MSLNGKHALITGSSRGIGRGIALKLAASGAKVAIHYFQNEAAANDTLGQVRKRGSDGLVIQADVRRPEQIIAMFGKVQAEFGKLDIFVSNARTDLPTFYQKPLEITPEQWDMAMDSQAKAFLLGAREAARLMSDEGRVIAITYSPGGRTGSWQPWGGDGVREGSARLAGALLRRGLGPAPYHRQRHQPRRRLRPAQCSRGWYLALSAARHPGRHASLARGRVDADETARDPRRHR